MYDFAPNSLQFCTKFITISHQILYDLAPNSLRFRTKFIKMSQQTFTLILMISHQNCYDFAPNQEFIWDKIRPKYP